MQNKHLVPQMIIDIAEKAKSPNDGAYLARLEAIRDYCSEILNKYEAEQTKYQKRTK